MLDNKEFVWSLLEVPGVGIFIYYFTFGCTRSSLLHTGYLLVAVCGLLIAMSSLVSEHGHMGFGSCDTWARLPSSMWNLPRPGIKPVSPALAAGFFFFFSFNFVLGYSPLTML